MRIISTHCLRFARPGVSLLSGPYKAGVTALKQVKIGEAFITVEPNKPTEVEDWVRKDPMYTLAMQSGWIEELVPKETVQVPTDRKPNAEEVENARKILELAGGGDSNKGDGSLSGVKAIADSTIIGDAGFTDKGDPKADAPDKGDPKAKPDKGTKATAKDAKACE